MNSFDLNKKFTITNLILVNIIAGLYIIMTNYESLFLTSNLATYIGLTLLFLFTAAEDDMPVDIIYILLVPWLLQLMKYSNLLLDNFLNISLFAILASLVVPILLIISSKLHNRPLHVYYFHIGLIYSILLFSFNILVNFVYLDSSSSFYPLLVMKILTEIMLLSFSLYKLTRFLMYIYQY